MTDPLVTVVIPSFNYGKFVTEAVESALAQTYRPCEIVVVDDGSTDDTRGHLAPYLARIQYVYQDNQGLHAARNTGIRAARGEFIGLLDSDDLWHPRKLELQIQVFREHPEAGLVAAEGVEDLREGWPEIDDAQTRNVSRITLEEMLICARFGASGVLLRKACLNQVGLFADGLRGVEDRDLWLRIAERFAIYKTLAPLWWYRIHATSMSAAVYQMEANELKMLRQAFATMPALRGRWLLKRRAFGRALVANAHMFDVAGRYPRSLANLARSYLQWPFPFRRSEVKSTLMRPKMVLLILGRWLKGLAGR